MSYQTELQPCLEHDRQLLKSILLIPSMGALSH